MRGSGFIASVRLGVSSLMLHKLRSGLTTLGVLFGTSSVIAMLAIGEGASAQAQEQIKRLGSQNVILRSVKPAEDQNQGSQTTRILSYGLTHDDHERVAKSFPSVGRVVPSRLVAQEVRFEDRVIQQPRIVATIPEWLEVSGRSVEQGRFLTEIDSIGAKNVCVLGTELARDLFLFKDPVGQRVKLGADYFNVVGTITPRVRFDSDAPGAGEETTKELFIPLTTADAWFGEMNVSRRAGSFNAEEVQLHELLIGVDDKNDVIGIANAAREMLERFHNEKDYEVVVPLELLAQADETKRIFNIVLGSIAGISLLVGGIGIMNVMLATVTERTREIGIRRALGAKRRDIVTQFLVETVVLSVGGGLFGVALGLAIPQIVEWYTDMPTMVTLQAPILAFTISAGIGVLFGIYPAWRASHMDPVDALRHE
ncbi:MAG: putative ABC transport system permease protein [Bacteroidia bacterium]|jgi:putative ABC transport system permease protein